MAPKGPAWQPIRDHFGIEMFDKHGTVDRQKLGMLVFGNDSARLTLNNIVHPHVRASIEEWFTDIEGLPNHKFGVVAIPLYYESSRSDKFDRIIVTACQADRQLARVKARGLTTLQAKRRIEAQMPTAKKVILADYTIWTDGLPTDTNRRVKVISDELVDLTETST